MSAKRLIREAEVFLNTLDNPNPNPTMRPYHQGSQLIIAVTSKEMLTTPHAVDDWALRCSLSHDAVAVTLTLILTLTLHPSLRTLTVSGTLRLAILSLAY